MNHTIDITKKAMDLSDDIGEVLNEKIMEDCIGALMICLVNSIITTSDGPEQAKVAVKIITTQLNLLVLGFCKDHEEGHEVWDEELQTLQ